MSGVQGILLCIADGCLTLTNFSAASSSRNGWCISYISQQIFVSEFRKLRSSWRSFASGDWLTKVFVASNPEGLQNLKAQVAPSGSLEFGTSAASLHATVAADTANAPKVWPDVNVLAEGAPVGDKFVANTFKISKTSFDRPANPLAPGWNTAKRYEPQ
jgi:hypothetical protein